MFCLPSMHAPVTILAVFGFMCSGAAWGLEGVCTACRQHGRKNKQAKELTIQNSLVSCLNQAKSVIPAGVNATLYPEEVVDPRSTRAACSFETGTRPGGDWQRGIAACERAFWARGLHKGSLAEKKSQCWLSGWGQTRPYSLTRAREGWVVPT